MAATQNTVDNRNANDARTARNCVFGLYAMSAIWGVIQIVVPENGMLYLAAAFLFALLATGWEYFDAKLHRITFLPILQLLYFLLWPIGAMFYLLYRSGVRGLLIAVVHGFGLTVTHALAFYTTFYGLHFAGMLDSRYYQ